MKSLFTIFLILCSLQSYSQTANAGADQLIPRSQGFAVLNGSASTGATTYHWRLITSVTAGVGIGHIGDTSAAITGTHILPTRNNDTTLYSYELSINSGADLDTTVLKVYWDTPHPPQESVSQGRYTTVGDIGVIPNCDDDSCWYIDGANDGWSMTGDKVDIYLDSSANVRLRPGKKVLIKAGIYNDINLNFHVDSIRGSAANPVLITNSGGQVECTRFRINNFKGTKVTGKYVAGVSGDIGYQGHANGAYAWSQGTYGIYVNNRWQSTQSSGMSVVGKLTDSVTLEYIESCNGSFTTCWVKDPSSIIDYHVTINDCYFHDALGEGIYLGQTSGGSQPHIYLTMFNNRVARSGNENIQTGQLGAGTRIYNNAAFMGATRFFSPFQDNQSTGWQFGGTNGNIYGYNNYISGAGQQVLSLFQATRSGDTPISDTLKVYNSFFVAGMGNIGNFFKQVDNQTGLVIDMSHLYLGQNFFRADSVYESSNPASTNTQHAIRANLVATFNPRISCHEDTLDQTKTTLIINSGTNVDSVNTGRVASIPRWTANTGFNNTTDPTNYGFWADKYYATMGDEDNNQSGTRQGENVLYATGRRVFWMGKSYISLVNNNTNNMPSGSTDAYWQLETFSGHTVPPDDFREHLTDTIRAKNIGLLDYISSGGGTYSPFCSAGQDQILTLPGNTTLLGSATGNPIANWLWSKTSGVGTATITTPTKPQTTVNNLQVGVYKFDLKVTDVNGKTARDTMQLTVKSAPTPPPAIDSNQISITWNKSISRFVVKWSVLYASVKVLSVQYSNDGISFHNISFNGQEWVSTKTGTYYKTGNNKLYVRTLVLLNNSFYNYSIVKSATKT